MTYRLTEHAELRMNQRCISGMFIEVVIRYGERIQQNGAIIYFLGRRHVPSDVAPPQRDRLAGIVVILSRGGDGITAYHSQRLPRKLRRRV